MSPHKQILALGVDRPQTDKVSLGALRLLVARGARPGVLSRPRFRQSESAEPTARPGGVETASEGWRVRGTLARGF